MKCIFFAAMKSKCIAFGCLLLAVACIAASNIYNQDRHLIPPTTNSDIGMPDKRWRCVRTRGAVVGQETLEVRSDIIVTNGNVRFDLPTKGPVCMSPDGTRWRIRVKNDGSIVAVQL